MFAVRMPPGNSTLLPRLAVRALCSSQSKQLRGADALLTPKQREARNIDPGSDSTTMRIRKAQLERTRKLRELYDVDAPAGSPISGSHLDAKLAAAERAGEFRNLAGSGKPLPERLRTHFGDEDAVDRMMMRLMAENNVRPESMELKATYRPKLKAFRGRLREVLREMPSTHSSSLHANLRASLTHEMTQLHKLHAAFKTAAVKDSLTYNLPINPLPKLAPTLEEELADMRNEIENKGRED